MIEIIVHNRLSSYYNAFLGRKFKNVDAINEYIDEYCRQRSWARFLLFDDVAKVLYETEIYSGMEEEDELLKKEIGIAVHIDN